MRFLHTGDLHLDSAFCASGTLGAERKRDAQRATFGKIFDLAREKGCCMVLISGDLFDSRYVTPETEKYVREVIDRSGIPVVVSPGNHDPYVAGLFYSRADLPENLYVFNTSKMQRFDFPELCVSVYGYAFTSPSLTYSPLVGESGEGGQAIKLLCAHADLGATVSRYCPLTVGDITGLSVNYAALGHIHNRTCDDSAENTVIRYCGFPQGRSFDELGDGGVFIVDCDEDGSVIVDRVCVSEQKYEVSELDIGGCADSSAIQESIRRKAREYAGDKATHLRITLVGTVDRDEMPDLESLAAQLAEDKLLSVEIKDTTLPLADIESLKADKTLRGEFYRALYSRLISEDVNVRECAGLALRIGLAAIEGRKISGDVDSL